MAVNARVLEEPQRPPTWLLGSGHGIQVWTVDVDDRVRASVLIGEESPVVLLNEIIVGTPLEGEALNWALARVAMGERGFYVWRA